MKEIQLNYNSPGELKTFLDTHNMAMQKKFGQNFLVNGKARTQLVDVLDIDTTSQVWEIGPGLGAMTHEILSRGASLTVFEIDRGFVQILNNLFSEYGDKFQLIEGDVLKTWKKQINNGIPDRFFGNLPYNIAATLIGSTIEQEIRFEKAVVTVQKEVALRMTAQPGSENYSAFSVLCQWAYNIEPVMDLTGSNFWPRPNIDSRAVLMTRKSQFPRCQNPELFMKLQRALFVSRRKTVKNNLTFFSSDNKWALDVLKKADIDPQIRAEKLSVEKILLLSDIIDIDIIKKKVQNGIRQN